MKPVEAALLAKARRLGPRQKRLRLPPAPLPRHPIEIERQYSKTLQAEVVARLEKITRAMLLPRIGAVLSEARDDLPRADSEGVRADAYSRTVEAIFAGMRVRYAQELTEREIEQIALRYAARGEDWNQGQLALSLQRVLGLSPITAEPYLQPIMRQFVDENTRLIRSIGEEYFGKVQQDTYRMVQMGVYNKEYAKQIRSEYEGEFQRQWERGVLKRRVENADARARLIARDQISKYNGQLNQTRQTALGISKYRWVTSGDERVRDSHAANAGKVFSWDDPPATGHPGDDYQCRCVAQPVFDEGVSENRELLRLLNA